MICLPLLTNECVEGNWLTGSGGDWDGEGEAKWRLRSATRSELKWDWFLTVLFSPQKAIWRSWKVDMQILWTLKDLGSLHSDRASGQSLAFSWNHGVPTFLCHWGLISPVQLLGCNHPYLHFLPHVCDIFWLFLPVFSALPTLFSLFLFPHIGAENFLCCRGPQHDQRIWGKLPLQGEHQFFFLPTEHPVFFPQDSWQLSGEEPVNTAR